MDNTECDAVTQTMRCTDCGDEVPIPYGSIDWVTGVLDAFVKAHKSCRGVKGTTRFSTPTILTNGGENNGS